MPLSMTPGSSIIASPELRCRHGLRRDLNGSALPIFPQSVSRGARISGLPDSRICYSLPSCSLSWTDQTDTLAPESFYFQASNGSVALPVAGYDYNSDWTPCMGLFVKEFWQGGAFFLRQFLCSIKRPVSSCDPYFAHAGTRRSCQGWPSRQAWGMLHPC